MGSKISAIRVDDNIDVYVAQQDQLLKHYWMNPQTNWQFNEEIISNQIIGKPAVIRSQNNIDLFVRTANRTLVHFWCGDYTNWAYKSEVLAYEISDSSDPAAVRWNNDIDVFYFDCFGTLINLHASPDTNWTYENKKVHHSNGYCSNLLAIRIKREAIDIYFIESERLMHFHTGDHTQWQFFSEQILPDRRISSKALSVVRVDNFIDLFYCNELGTISQLCCSDRTAWKYEDNGCIFKNSAIPIPQVRDFSVVRNGDHIDIYFRCDDNCVHHTYSGANNNWMWQADEIISPPDVSFGISAVRPHQKAIDVFYLGANDKLNLLFIGEGTNNNWSTYELALTKPVLQWELIRSFAKRIGEGYHGKVYLIQTENDRFIVKKFKFANPGTIRAEMRILDKLAPIWPDLCKATVFEGGQLVGFAMTYFEGRKLNDVLQEKDNILHKSTSAQVKLIKKLGECVSKIQKLGICHSDLSLDNVLVQQKNKYSKKFDIRLIDFGNSLLFNSNTITQSCLTGWKFLKPPESRLNRPFNPSRVNAYQFARVSMQILLLTPFSDYKHIDPEPYKELKRLTDKGFPKKLLDFLSKASNSKTENRKIDLRKLESIKWEFAQKAPKSCHFKPEKFIRNGDFPLLDFIKHNPNAEWSCAVIKGNNYQLIYGSCGVEFKDNIFFTVKAEAKIAVMRIFNETDTPLKNVSIEVLTASVSVSLGSYNGFDLHVALVEGQLSCFDIKLGVGIDSGVGIEDDSHKMKVMGAGLICGRRLGISLYGSEFAIDFKRFFTKEQWDVVKPIIQFSLSTVLDGLAMTPMIGEFVKGTLEKGRMISIKIINYKAVIPLLIVDSLKMIQRSH